MLEEKHKEMISQASKKSGKEVSELEEEDEEPKKKIMTNFEFLQAKVPTQLYRYKLPMFGSTLSVIIYFGLAILYITIFVFKMLQANTITGQTVVYESGGYYGNVAFTNKFDIQTNSLNCKDLTMQIVSQSTNKQNKVKFQQVAIM